MMVRNMIFFRHIESISQSLTRGTCIEKSISGKGNSGNLINVLRDFLSEVKRVGCNI